MPGKSALALAEEKKDGIKRVFQISADLVRQEVPRYGKFVDGEVAKHGRNNPFIKTQYYSEEIDETGGMFPPERIAMLKGNHPYQLVPMPGRLYAFCLDVAGTDENTVGAQGLRPGQTAADVRDKTALTIFELILPDREQHPARGSTCQPSISSTAAAGRAPAR